MRKIFVPLNLGSASDSTQIDAVEAALKFQRLMVIGAPGSGKSVLLRHLLLKYADGALDYILGKPVAVYLELHRLNVDDRPILEQVAAGLARNDFPNSIDLLGRLAKEERRLLLLFDGLDEVRSENRSQVVQKIKDFLDEYKCCRAVITCRSIVYEGEFDDRVNATLSVSEFSDAQIRRFLGAWEADMPASKSVNQLMLTLQDRPRIMALARNPLLLTIVAYLYTDTTIILPQSRADFYKRSTDIFLESWQEQHNRFHARDKRSILRALALRNQDELQSDGADRLSVPYQTVLAQVRELIPNLDLPRTQEPGPLIDEIVERSGLLLEVDGGERIQFAHLTLQEFFAAEALLDNEEGLVARFASRPNTWRETAKLWCGLAKDSTKLIKQIEEIELPTAFECLADSIFVDPALATSITDRMAVRLPDATADPNVARAFAALASGQGERSRRVFDFLSASCAVTTDPQVRDGAIVALSMTNMPEASRQLAMLYQESDSLLRSSLVRMGDVAVPMLVELGREGVVAALEDLGSVATPAAVLGLVGLLTNTFAQNIQRRAAWSVAALLPNPGIEAAIELGPIPESTRDEKEAWVWKPFGKEESNVSRVASRVYAEMSKTLDGDLDIDIRTRLDPRLIIPLAIEKLLQSQQRIRMSMFSPFDDTILRNNQEILTGLALPRINDIDDALAFLARGSDTFTSIPRLGPVLTAETEVSIPESVEKQVLDNVYTAAELNLASRMLLSGMSAACAAKCLRYSASYEQISFKKDWAKLFILDKFSFEGSTGHVICEIVTLVFLVATFVSSICLFVASLVGTQRIPNNLSFLEPIWQSTGATLRYVLHGLSEVLATGLIAIVSATTTAIIGRDVVNNRTRFSSGTPLIVWLGPILLFSAIWDGIKMLMEVLVKNRKLSFDTDFAIIGPLGTIALIGIVLFVFVPVTARYGYVVGTISFIAVYVIGGLIYVRGISRERRARNPLRHYFQDYDFVLSKPLHVTQGATETA